jgi:hypothetical protein
VTKSLSTHVWGHVQCVLSAIEVATLKNRPRSDERQILPVSIQYDICLKNQLRRQWQETRDLALKAEVNRFQDCRTPNSPSGSGRFLYSGGL